MTVFLYFHNFLLTFGSIPCESSDYGVESESRNYVIAACSISVFHVSGLGSLIRFQKAISECAEIVGERTKNVSYSGFTNLGSIVILEFWF